MDDATRLERARAFGANPADYDAARPGYPDGLFQALGSYAGLRDGARVLEIGCGTGQATRSLADLDIRLTALEPSAELAALARSNFAQRGNIQILTTDFESFEPTDPFDLVLAATSFHWIDPDTRYAKAARLLRPGGALAIASNTHPPPYTGFFEAVQACYDRHVPEWAARRQPDFSWDRGQTDSYEEELRADPRFADVRVHRFDWQARFTAEGYARLLHTFSDHIRLGPDRLAALVADIGRLIDEEYDGAVRRPYRSVLRLARRRQPG